MRVAPALVLEVVLTLVVVLIAVHHRSPLDMLSGIHCRTFVKMAPISEELLLLLLCLRFVYMLTHGDSHDLLNFLEQVYCHQGLSYRV